MRGWVAAAAVVLLAGFTSVAGAATSRPGAPRPLVTSMTVTASPHAAGASRTTLAVTLRYEMQCGYAGAGPLTVTFPAAFRLPWRFAARSVVLGGKPVAATVDGQRVTVTVAPHRGVMCDVIGPGSISLVFQPAARLALPARAGSYRFAAVHTRRAFGAVLTIG